jgi:hypothetical protein
MSHDNDDLLPTWWERFPPSIRWRHDIHETARGGGMPITAAVFDRIPDHDAYIPYYLYLCTWCDVSASATTSNAAYRKTPRSRRLHARAVLDGLIRYANDGQRLPCLLRRWAPLLDLDPLCVWEEALGHIRNNRYVHLSDAAFATLANGFLRTDHPRIRNMILNPATRTDHITWVTEKLIPFRASGEPAAEAQHNRDRFTRLWTTIFAPAVDAATAAVYEAAANRTAAFREELLATTWDYPLCLRLCMDEREGAAVADRWLSWAGP